MEYDLLRYQGDLKPPIRLTLFDGGSVVSLPPGTTVDFTMTARDAEGGTPVISDTGSVVGDGSAGQVEYAPGVGGWPAAGLYSAWFTVDDGTGAESWPANGYLTVLILAT